MSEISWIKLKTKMFDDEKIQLIEAMPEADAILVIWIKLLIQAGKTNANGFILLSENIPYTPEMISTIFRRPLQIVKFALKTLNDLGMIEVTDRNVICISNWEKHQNIEGLDKVREQNRIRQNKFREKKLLLQADNKQSITLHNVTVTEQNKTKIKREKKKKETILKNTDAFNKFWELYAKPIAKGKCEKEFSKLTIAEVDECLNHTPRYVQSTPDLQYRCNPLKYLVEKRFEDKIIIKEKDNGSRLGKTFGSNHNYEQPERSKFNYQ